MTDGRKGVNGRRLKLQRQLEEDGKIIVKWAQEVVETLYNLLNFIYIHIYIYIQGVPGGKVNILGGHSIGHSKQNYIHVNMYPIPNGFRDRAI